MGFFTDGELASLRIENMILHVVSEDEFAPQEERAVEHPDFFIDRIRDTDASPVFDFDPNSQTKTQLQRMASGADTFERGAQALSREFARFHGGSSRAGAFFVFELACQDPSVRLYSLIKYDYQQVIEQGDAEDGNLLRLIVQAFVAQKRAVQKSALVRVVDGVAEDAVSARDRMKPAPDIGDYFGSFLHVARSHSDEQLNRKMLEVVRNTLAQSRDMLPGRDVARAYRHAQGVLRDRVQINGDAVAEAIIAAAGVQENEDARAELDARTRRKLRNARIDGLAFRPDLIILRRPPIRRVKTTEGVVVTYPDEADGAVVRRERLEGGREVITIHTEQVTEDDLVRDGSRAAG